jgi:hypothetical protein
MTMSKWKILLTVSILLAVFITGLFLNDMIVSAQTSTFPGNTEEADLMLQSSMQSAHFSIAWDVIGQGGGETSSPHFNVTSTVGQSAAGNTSSTSFKNHAGFWLNWIRKLFLPLIIR